MKKMIYASLLLLTILFTTSFTPNNAIQIVLSGTKWISPIADDCYDSLCFTSDETVMFYRCGDGYYWEIGYAIKGNHVEINAYSKDSMEPESMLVLFEDNGVLRQVETQDNSFPRIYIKVPAGNCD